MNFVTFIIIFYPSSFFDASTRTDFKSRFFGKWRENLIFTVQSLHQILSFFYNLFVTSSIFFVLSSPISFITRLDYQKTNIVHHNYYTLETVATFHNCQSFSWTIRYHEFFLPVSFQIMCANSLVGSSIIVRSCCRKIMTHSTLVLCKWSFCFVWYNSQCQTPASSFNLHLKCRKLTVSSILFSSRSHLHTFQHFVNYFLFFFQGPN